MFSFFSNFRSRLSLAAAFLMLGTLLAGCGDSGSTATPQGATTTSVSSTTAAAGTTTLAASSTSVAGATTAATGGTTVATNGTTVAGTPAAASGATNVSQEAVGPCRDADAPPLPTPTVPVAAGSPAAPAALPDLSYNNSRELKAQDATAQGVLANVNGPSFASVVGKFTADKLSFFTTSDSFDKVDAAYRKTLEGAGWTQSKNENDAANKQILLVYEKSGTKVVITVEQVADLNNYPTEFKEFIKAGDTLMLIASGKAVSGSGPAPTPFAIPGSPVAQLSSGQHPYATIELEKGGKIVIELCPNLAPKTVENFEKLTTKGFYNGLTFHRVEKSPTPFVVQGGDPKGDGTGGPGYNIPDEFTNQKKHLRGTVAMAHSSAPNSAGSQFYICLADTPNLNGAYAIFGQVTEGMDLVDKIAIGDKMKSVTISVK